jgi:3-methylcrotonyl-CoA carboxylase beta subunit
MNCNQDRIPLLFFQDVMGFMVGKAAEESGIIRRGAKLVNAVSNSIVPKITVIVGNSFGAGHYAMCGKAYDPDFILAWPNAKYSVMGAEQAADTLVDVRKRAAARNGKILDDEEADQLHEEIRKSYRTQMDIRYGAARGWIDAVIAPHTTRDVLIQLLQLVMRRPIREASGFHTGVLQV